MARLDGEVAVVTGASSGIGRETARALAGEGAALVLAARRRERLDDLVGELEAGGAEALAVPGDLREEAAVEALREASEERFGRVDILVNNAGVGAYGPVESFTVEDYDRMMDSNVRTSFLCTQAFLPGMRQRGHGQICFLASVAGLRGLPDETIYCASKFAQVGFAQALDHEVREEGVRVSVVAPGGVHTEFAIGAGRTPGDPSLERMMDPAEVAEALVFALTRPAGSRAFLVGVRPVSEAL